VLADAPSVTAFFSAQLASSRIINKKEKSWIFILD